MYTHFCDIVPDWHNLDFAAFAIPAFFIFVGLEYFVSRKKRKDVFQFETSVANMSIGVAERLLNLFLTATFYNLFQWIFVNYALWQIPHTWYVWIILLLTTDLVWYWYHRIGHEVNIIWAAHVVHHQSEAFNYTVSARITSAQAIVRNTFWCILPWAGFHPDMVIAMLVVHGTYSFFTHTQLVPRLGWLEYVLITPSHHRVHHASNEKYLNKNYGDLFVFWDKLFGTFQVEEEEPRYGLTHPLRSFSFVWQHVHYFAELWSAVISTRGAWARLRILFGPPEMLDQRIRPALERRLVPQATEVPLSKRVMFYVVGQLIIAVAVLFVFAFFFKLTSNAERMVISAVILITLINCGALLQQRKWIYYLEFGRLLILAGILSVAMANLWALAATLMFILVTAESFEWKKVYLRAVYG
jgi:alkylglycerol monooxygenase